MRVLFIRHTPLRSPDGGAPHYFPVALARLGHLVTVIARGGGDSRSLTSANVRVIDVSRSESWLAWLRKAARSVQPDIVHVFLHSGCGFYPLIMTGDFRSRFVVDIRSPLLRTGVRGCLSRLKNRLEVTAYDSVAAHGVESGRTVIGNGRDVVWVPPGVDFSAVPARQMRQSSNGTIRLVYVGSLDRKRRIEQMVAAVSVAAADIPLTLDIYGNGDGKRDIIRMIEDRRVSQVIRLPGAIPNSELFERFLQYDIGLAYVPRRLYDTALPLKTLEYMACGLPVVATDTLGNRMVVQSGINGLLAAEDPQSFANGIRELARAPWLSAASENARRSVEPYDWIRIVSQRLIPLYHRLLQTG